MFRVAWCSVPNVVATTNRQRPLAYARRRQTSPTLVVFSTHVNPPPPPPPPPPLSSPSELHTSTTTTAPTNTKTFPFIRPRFPKRIILLRHGESLGNVDESLYGEIPDWKIPLTRRGEKQSLKAATDLYALTKNEFIFCYCSPYTRAKETWKIMSQHIAEQGDVTLIGTREEPRIAEQQFGNFQSESMCMRACVCACPCVYVLVDTTTAMVYIVGICHSFIHPTLSSASSLSRSKKGPNSQD